MEVWSTPRKKWGQPNILGLSDSNHKSTESVSLLLMDSRSSPARTVGSLSAGKKITAISNSHTARNTSRLYSVTVFCRTAAHSLLLTESLFTARGVRLNATDDKSINFPESLSNQTQDLHSPLILPSDVIYH